MAVILPTIEEEQALEEAGVLVMVEFPATDNINSTQMLDRARRLVEQGHIPVQLFGARLRRENERVFNPFYGCQSYQDIIMALVEEELNG